MMMTCGEAGACAKARLGICVMAIARAMIREQVRFFFMGFTPEF